MKPEMNKIDPFHVVQIFVFKGEDYLGWDCFTRDKIIIGSSRKANLVLADERVAGVHAVVYMRNGGIVVKNKGHKDGIAVIPGHLDFFEVGPFTLKIKLKKTAETAHSPKTKDYPEKAGKIENRGDKEKKLSINPKKAVSEPGESEKTEPAKVETEINTPEPVKPEEEKTREILNKETKSAKKIDFPVVYREDDNDEEDDDGFEADFKLNEEIRDEFYAQDNAKEKEGKGPFLVEIVKSRNGSISDIKFLNSKDRYVISSGNSRFTLAENKDGKSGCFYFTNQMAACVKSHGKKVIDSKELLNSKNLSNKKKSIFEYQIPLSGRAEIEYQGCEYLLRIALQGKSPEVKDPPTVDHVFWNHLVKSIVFHLFILLALGLFPSFQTNETEMPVGHFIKIDTRQIAEIQKMIKPKQPKVSPKPKSKPKPRRFAKKIRQNRPAASGSRRAHKKRRVAVKRHPKAGGGFGKGNILNRDVNQAGILSMLGSSVGITPKDAMASVTNLDAVTTTSSARPRFKVGGIKGKLGTGKIALSFSDVVETKGTSQVLRSAGARGKGRVAAMKKGKIGQSQVMGMVSVNLDKKVHVQGGMSRQAVKRVIDQHLSEITDCYENALIANPSIMGKVVFEWKILLSGRVGEVRIKTSSVNSNDIHSCIKSAIASWQFPKPKGAEVVVSYPFIFDIVGF